MRVRLILATGLTPCWDCADGFNAGDSGCRGEGCSIRLRPPANVDAAPHPSASTSTTHLANTSTAAPIGRPSARTIPRAPTSSISLKRAAKAGEILPKPLVEDSKLGNIVEDLYRLVRLIALDWFDGPTEAVVLSDARESLHCRLAGEPPITGASVYVFRWLRPSAFAELESEFEAEYGPAAAPIWVPRVDPSLTPRETSALNKRIEPRDAQLGYAQTDSLVDQELHVIWLDAPIASSAAGAVRWVDVLRAQRRIDDER
ncbi:MAG: hypothetical protein QOG42_2696 [Solirubrobacteraceae bacterium]|nr:hypothetical protein [Solirubrobacteraceae bacterium]